MSDFLGKFEKFGEVQIAILTACKNVLGRFISLKAKVNTSECFCNRPQSSENLPESIGEFLENRKRQLPTTCRINAPIETKLIRPQGTSKNLIH